MLVDTIKMGQSRAIILGFCRLDSKDCIIVGRESRNDSLFDFDFDFDFKGAGILEIQKRSSV